MMLGYVLIDDVECEITNMYDSHGDDTDDIERAFAIVFYHPDGYWVSACVKPYGEVLYH